jgi:hypothetical protein
MTAALTGRTPRISGIKKMNRSRNAIIDFQPTLGFKTEVG